MKYLVLCLRLEMDALIYLSFAHLASHFCHYDCSLTWHGREVDDGRYHGTQANEDPQSEQHPASCVVGQVTRVSDSRRQSTRGTAVVARERADKRMRTGRCRTREHTSKRSGKFIARERVDARLKERSFTSRNHTVACSTSALG